LIIFGKNVTDKVSNQKMLYFPPHLTSTSALAEKTGNPEFSVFHLNAACCFASKHIKNITWSQMNHPSLSK